MLAHEPGRALRDMQQVAGSCHTAATAVNTNIVTYRSRTCESRRMTAVVRADPRTLRE